MAVLKHPLCTHCHVVSNRHPEASLDFKKSISTKLSVLSERITCPPVLNDKRRFINADAAGSNMK